MIIDTHAHLTDERLINEVPTIVSDMAKDNLKSIITVGYDRQSSEQGYKLSCTHKGIYCAVGIHPHDAKNVTQADYDYFASVASAKEVVAYGEIGLDYYYDLSERDVQKAVFCEQLELAHSLKKPVAIHLRDAYEDMSRLLKENKHYIQHGMVIHCYAGSEEMLKEYNKYDSYYSFGGAITFKNAKKDDIVRAIPKNRLLLETDCPYMTPVPYRGKTNYPKYVNIVAERVKEMMPEIDIEGLTTANAEELFGINDNI
ncbi:MAG: TatD family hydrolase [Bacillota bacterium]